MARAQEQEGGRPTRRGCLGRHPAPWLTRAVFLERELEGEGAFVGSGDARPGQGGGVGGGGAVRQRTQAETPPALCGPLAELIGFLLHRQGLAEPGGAGSASLSCSPIREVGIQNHCPVLETEG